MSKTAKYLSQHIQNLCQEYGILVWYDPKKVFASLLEKLELNDIALYRYEGSFLHLRYQIEPLISADEKPRMLIYIPMDRMKTQHVMLEAEVAGCYLAPDHPKQKFKTQLAIVASNVLQPIIPNRLEEILRKVQAGDYGLQDIDKLAEAGYSAGISSLNLIYDRNDPLDILFNFIVREEKDRQIKSKKLQPDIVRLINNQLGFSLLTHKPISEIREELWRLLLINDFIISAEMHSLPDTMSSIPIAQSELEQKNIIYLTEKLRQYAGTRMLYQEKAKKIERNYKLQLMEVSINSLKNVQTFPFVETYLLKWCYDQLLSDRYKEVSSILQLRHNSFWRQTPPFNLQWDWLSLTVKLIEQLKAIRKELKNRQWKPAAMIIAYTRKENPWCLLDKLYRELEISFQVLESDSTDILDLLERTMVKIQHEYTAMLREMAEIFQNALKDEDFDFKDGLLQRELFDQKILPDIKKSKKVAFIQVDALRYEMALSLQKMLAGMIDVDLQPVIAQLPGITSVGMAAALPGAEKFIQLATDRAGSIGLEINQKEIFTRQDRKKYLMDFIGEKEFFETKLDSIIKPKKSIRENLSTAKFIWITSQEIDVLGENLNHTIARQLMEKLLDNIRLGIKQLLKSGVDKVVITADHGYLFGEEIDPGEKIDPPGGDTRLLHRRVWIGRGGAAHSSYWRVPESQLGLSGPLELIFPWGISCFKSPGGNEVYFHGGISLQEMVVPLLEVVSRTVATPGGGQGQLNFRMEKSEITNRFFTVQAEYQPTELFAEESKRVRIIIQTNKGTVGRVVAAAYGFEQGTGDVILQRNKLNVITLVLEKELPPQTVDIILQDIETEAVLTKISNVPIHLTI